MDFSRIELDDADREFLLHLRSSLKEWVTDDVISRDRATGDNFDEGLHLALGARGYLAGEWKSESDGGFSPVRRRLWELETRRAHMPYFTWDITAMVARAIDRFASPSLKREVLPGVLTGHVRLCLGYTEPEGGSDVATCKTRATRDGSAWIVNGSKMFTTGAHNCSYVFLITNTDPHGPKHKNLTMLLVPLDSPGIVIQPLRTVDGDRTNIVYYSDVRVDDKYRIGEVNGGWTVVRAALDEEHGIQEPDAAGLQDFTAMAGHAMQMAVTVDEVAAAIALKDANGRRLIDNQSVKYRLGRCIARTEAALSTPEMFGRVAVAQTMREISVDLTDILGTAGSLPVDTDGSLDGGAAEYLFRWSLPTGIYGGTLEVFRNMIAQHALGLGRPNYATTK